MKISFNIKQNIQKLKIISEIEIKESLKMISDYKNWISGNSNCLSFAHNQLFDILKFIFIFFIFILPFGGVLLSFILAFSHRIGIKLLPSAFYLFISNPNK